MKANELPLSKLSHFKLNRETANPPEHRRRVRTVSVLELHIRTVSALSVLPAYFVRNLRTICGVRVASAAGHLYSQMSSVLCPRRPYSHRTASVAIRCYPPEMLANLSTRSVLAPYSLREISSVLYPLRSAASVRRCERGITV